MFSPARDLLSSLLSRPKKGPRRVDDDFFPSATPSPGPASREYRESRHATADFTEADDDEEEEEDDDDFDDGDAERPRFMPTPTRYRYDGNGPDNNARRNSTSLQPLFSAGYLDSIPVYSVVHAIRIIVQTRTETSLTWEQLRSPQVSQFLVKPMQQQIRTQHFTRATLYALMANCLQFNKEGQLYPANAGTSNTRAKVCELLALKLLKEYNTRELIDALSYDFYPLQGVTDAPGTPNRNPEARNRASASRSSTLEVAIRASAKNFLAHPLIVQHLEAIWNGAISFYSSADSMHREQPMPVNGSAGPSQGHPVDVRTPLLGFQSAKEGKGRLPLHSVPIRRTVTLYDPRHASLMKLSRLRVPRYRQFLSTCSLFVLICLFLAVLIQRSTRITSLELIFWFWSAGFMLDELVGFNEQGFSLYIMSFWNVFDLGILLLLVIYYCLRVYAVFLVNPLQWNDLAYDVLAANAILLMPRIFSVLDHYQYFSQLLIAFRLMAVDLIAVFVLILICCSGFFVFFTLSKNNTDAADVAFRIFQILMGFTPAAWDVWFEYNYLGRLLLGTFLILCHFVVVTILITVLTNSFMAIASNAKQEHQFLFAINTISMVKNDSLFSYIAPTNIIAWVLMPLRYVMTMRQFIVLNRTVIKVTHSPILFGIFLYEKLFLAPSIYEPTDLVENQGKGRGRAISFMDPASRTAVFSPNIRAREESVAGLQKDRALEEVFRRPPDASTLRTQRRQERRKTQTAIRHWMDQNDDLAEPLSHWNIDNRMDNHQSPRRRMSMSRDLMSNRYMRNVSMVRSTASDPADLMSMNDSMIRDDSRFMGDVQHHAAEAKDQTDADGDDELVTNDEDEDDVANTENQRDTQSAQDEPLDYFTTPIATRFGTLASSSLESSMQHPSLKTSPRSNPRRQGLHSRTLSTNTILFNPESAAKPIESPSPAAKEIIEPRSRPKSRHLGVETPHRSPRKSTHATPATRPRPIPSMTAPTRSALIPPDPRRGGGGRLSSVDMEINSEMGLDAHHEFNGVPASFATQMAMATGQLKALGKAKAEREDADRMSRLVLARMKTLEEGFADVVKEMRVMRSVVPTAQNSGDDGSWKSGAGGSILQGSEGRSGGMNRPKGFRSRPGSAKGEKRSGALSPRKQRARDKGKGKEVVRSAQDSGEGYDEEDEAKRTMRRGSSL